MMKTYRKAMLAATVVCLISLPGRLLASNSEPRALRWAILSSQPIQDTGIADLLTVELAQTTGFELVERDQIRTALAEIDLASLGGAKTSAERITLGGKVAADVLLLLEFKQGNRFAWPSSNGRKPKTSGMNWQINRILRCIGLSPCW